MNHELLETLLQALRFSPDNIVLRAQIVRGLLEAERWGDLETTATPLLHTTEHALACLALAHGAWHGGDTLLARTRYAEAITVDPSLADEDFEAELEPEDAMPLLADGFIADAAPGVQSYRGPRVTFADVGGMEALKEQIRLNILYPFTKPELYKAYGKKIGGGILLYGPPGCGKTHIARATAGELGASFYLLELNAILSMWMGESEKQLNQLFETARATAPSIIFIDEVDALGAKRSELSSSALRTSVTQLLTEMDGMSGRNTEVLVLGATNEPWHVDSAFRRPGRFDRVLFVPPPDAPAREEILRLLTRERTIDPKLPWRSLAEKTELFSGADLSGLIDRACEFALRDALRTGDIRPVAQADFLKALRDLRPSTLEWLHRAKNYVNYANQEGYYDDLSRYLATQRV